MNSISPDTINGDKEVSAGVITAQEAPAGGERRYLLLKHANGGHWSFPKGHVEKGENSKEAAVRELREETDLGPPEFIPDFRRKTHYTFTRNDRKISKTVIYFLGLVNPMAKVSLSKEHLEFRWLGCSEARDILTYESDRKLLLRAEDKLDRLGEVKNDS